jgi:hypothetical protein
MKNVCIVSLIVFLFGLAGCGLIGPIDEAIDACEGMTLEELKSIEDISDECRQAIEDLLPKDERNLDNKVIGAGIGTRCGKKLLFVMGSDLIGNPIDLSTLSGFTLTADGFAVPGSSYSFRRASEYDMTVLSLSCILDYSGSMRDIDIDDAVDVYKTIFSIPLGFEAEYTIFSIAIEKKTSFTKDLRVLSRAVERDNSFRRQRTALFDTMGRGIRALSSRSAPVKLLIVATDGLENNSTEITQESTLYRMAEENDIHFIMMGSVLADLDFMRRAAHATDGFYFYSKKFNNLRNVTDDFIRALEDMSVVEIADSAYTGASSYKVSFDGINLHF